MERMRRTDPRAGFTLVELVIVLTIMLIIAAIAVPGYHHLVLHAQEQTLRDDLRTMRRMIEQYSADKQKAPATLQDLVEAKYLPEIPVDPMTGSADTWEVIQETDPLSLKGDQGIVDVKSGSNDVDSSGQKRYSEW
jgi:general secretion pathway protein G